MEATEVEKKGREIEEFYREERERKKKQRRISPSQRNRQIGSKLQTEASKPNTHFQNTSLRTPQKTSLSLFIPAFACLLQIYLFIRPPPPAPLGASSPGDVF